ncbi:hypothetical protein SCORR_v1c05950 [Spiroplasma corruscae]|uniref:PD-(D/E)XK motif protein n=1 Tax=Spiroplasma corruscae TaxID=216934 RepID=A0A222EPE7_9MOLU|nr:PD-(D/E)XK motif protein [Spiroplasma corruscae]ASP28367.1 hypothetical protein SCORR_v1c05950 [Spiroplasma corruscae]
MNKLSMENINILENSNGFAWGKIQSSNQYFILKQIKDFSNLPKGVKTLNKPNFSYYPSISGIGVAAKEDERAIGFPSDRLLLEIDDTKTDAEIIFLVKNCPEKIARMIYEIFLQQATENSIYDIVCELENIFGVVWKIDKKFQIGLIGELLVIQKNQKYLNELSSSYHIENIKSKKFTSKTDFQIDHNNKNINIEVKTTTSQDGMFKMKNDQVNKNINDYYAAVSIKLVKKSGQTVIDLIDWFLKIPQLASEIKDTFEEIKKSHDNRTLVRFDHKNVILKFIDTKEIPYIENHSDLIKEVTYEVNLFSFKNLTLEEIFDN